MTESLLARCLWSQLKVADHIYNMVGNVSESTAPSQVQQALSDVPRPRQFKGVFVVP